MRDEELDNLFREAADQYRLTPGKEAWNGLEQNLKTGFKPAPRLWNRPWYWFGSSVVLLTVGALMLFRPYHPVRANHSGPSLTRQTEVRTGKLPENRTPLSGASLRNSSVPGPGIPRISSSRPEDSRSRVAGAQSSGPDRRVAASGLVPKASGRLGRPGGLLPPALHQAGIPALKDAARAGKPQGSLPGRMVRNFREPIHKGRQPSGYRSEYRIGQNANGLSANPGVQIIRNPGLNWLHPLGIPHAGTGIIGPPGELLPLLGRPASAGQKGGVVHLKKQSPAWNPANRWSLQLVSGPEWGSVKLKTPAQEGFDMGFLVDFRLKSKWSLESGLLFSKKLYVTQPRYYNPKYPLPDREELKEIEADCMVTDIPLNIRFDFLQAPRNRLFIKTGLSTFWMNRENYDFIYQSQPYSWEWVSELSNENLYILSVWNLSAGFESSLGKNISLVGEPFLKIPLQGIGFGRVKLTSFGMLLSLKYNF